MVLRGRDSAPVPEAQNSGGGMLTTVPPGCGHVSGASSGPRQRQRGRRRLLGAIHGAPAGIGGTPSHSALQGLLSSAHPQDRAHTLPHQPTAPPHALSGAVPPRVTWFRFPALRGLLLAAVLLLLMVRRWWLWWWWRRRWQCEPQALVNAWAAETLAERYLPELAGGYPLVEAVVAVSLLQVT